jgi:hypothetical protein
MVLDLRRYGTAEHQARLVVVGGGNSRRRRAGDRLALVLRCGVKLAKRYRRRPVRTPWPLPNLFALRLTEIDIFVKIVARDSFNQIVHVVRLVVGSAQ